MKEQLINTYLFESSYAVLFFAVVIYFLFLYLILGTLFLKTCSFLENKGILHKIVDQPISKSQYSFEVKHSLLSILIFGLIALVIVYFTRTELIQFSESTLSNTVLGLCILTIWNEVHFYVIHRLMHSPFFMKRVHTIHHRSTIPTVFSVFSFHWFEALLLASLPLTILPFIQLSLASVILFPLISILLNFAGHCNYRFGNGSGPNWTRFATEHQSHHFRSLARYGFASGLMDRFFKLFYTNQPKP